MALGTWTTHNASSNFNVTIPSATNRVAKLFVGLEFDTTPPTTVTATVGGVSLVSAGTAQRSTVAAGGFDCIVYAFYLLDASFPSTGTQAVAVSITGGTSVQGHRRAFAVDDGRAQEAPQFVSAGMASAQSSLALGPLNTVNDAYGSAAVQVTVSSTTQTIGGSWTERWDGADVGGDAAQAGGDITYSSTSTDTVTFTQSTASRAAGSFIVTNPVAAGPVVTDQPDNATAVVTPSTPVTFTAVSTTNGASLSQQWYRGASGTTTNPINTGGVYVTGASGTTTRTVTLTITPTDTSLNAETYWCRITDGSGSVDTNAATLTVLAGDVLVQPVGLTNGSGNPATSSGSLTSNAPGLTRLVATVGGVALDQVVVITKR